MDLDLVKKVGTEAAHEGGRILISCFGNLSEINKKSDIDLVTEADIESEKKIISIIHAAYPDHSILAEESGTTKGSEKYQWIIDPLDGTTNFAHKLGIFAVSIAFAVNNEIVMGIVFNPVTNEFFHSIKGRGAYLNDKQIQVSESESVSESLLVTGFPYNLKEISGILLKRFSQCLLSARGVRRLGSASIDLCYVAAGRFEGFWEQNLKPWDTAAGILIAREAGALITDFSGNEYNIYNKEILATNGKIHKEMFSVLEAEEPK